jgi:ABC-type multidrug transport system ATPase subunit
MNQLLISNLSKTYKNGTKALDNINLDIGNGIFGLLGPNGAGKSTLMRTLATLQQPDHGSVVLDEVNLLAESSSVRRMLGYLPQEFGLYPNISAQDLLNHLAILKGITIKKERNTIVDLLLHKTNLNNHRKKRLGTYSGGMKQRFGIAQALLTNPKLLIVDEPTAGLDPGERNRFHNLLADIGRESIVILSTHIVEDVKELCNKVAIINQGKVLGQGSPDDLINDLQGMIYKKSISESEKDWYSESYQVISEKLHRGQPLIHVFSSESLGSEFESIPSTLEDAYFQQISLSNAK